MLLWAVAAMAAVAVLWGAAVWTRAGRLSRKLDALTQSYWELRYDYTRLKSQVARLDPETPEQAPAPGPVPGQLAFVPLSSIRKKNA